MLEHTLAASVECTGVGLHTGNPVYLSLNPAPPGAGISFTRVDLDVLTTFPARSEWVVDTTLATTLGSRSNPEAKISTIEHLLSALRGMGVDNCIIEIAGDEVPIMDGSATPFVNMIKRVGLIPQDQFRREIVIHKPIEVQDGDRWIKIIPSDHFYMSILIDFNHPSIGRQYFTPKKISQDYYIKEIAPARTFGFLKDFSAMKKLGLAKGGTLDNAVVVGHYGVVNQLRYPDEFVRHKILDLLGDLALLGYGIQGHVMATKTGHTLNQMLVDKIRRKTDCWSLEFQQKIVESNIIRPIPKRVFREGLYAE